MVHCLKSQLANVSCWRQPGESACCYHSNQLRSEGVWSNCLIVWFKQFCFNQKKIHIKHTQLASPVIISFFAYIWIFFITKRILIKLGWTGQWVKWAGQCCPGPLLPTRLVWTTLQTKFSTHRVTADSLWTSTAQVERTSAGHRHYTVLLYVMSVLTWRRPMQPFFWKSLHVQATKTSPQRSAACSLVYVWAHLHRIHLWGCQYTSIRYDIVYKTYKCDWC